MEKRRLTKVRCALSGSSTFCVGRRSGRRNHSLPVSRSFASCSDLILSSRYISSPGGLFLVADSGTGKTGYGAPAWFGGIPCDYDFFAGRSGHFPVWLDRERLPRGTKIDTNAKYIANLSMAMRRHLRQLGFDDPDKSRESAILLWLHALTVLYAPAYQRENFEAICMGWPRIPIPEFTNSHLPAEARELLIESAALGRLVAELLVFDGITQSNGKTSTIGGLYVDGCVVAPEEVDTAALMNQSMMKTLRNASFPPIYYNAILPVF